MKNVYRIAPVRKRLVNVQTNRWVPRSYSARSMRIMFMATIAINLIAAIFLTRVGQWFAPGCHVLIAVGFFVTLMRQYERKVIPKGVEPMDGTDHVERLKK